MAEAIDWEGLGLPPDGMLQALRLRCPDATPMRFADGDLIVDAQDTSRACVLLVRGSCLVEEPGGEVQRRAGHEIAVVEASPESPVFIGEMASLVEGTERVATVRSAMNAWGIRLAPADLDIIIEHFPDLTRILCRALSQRLREVSLHLRWFRNAFALDFSHVLFAAGDILCRQGDPPGPLWQLIQGSVQLEQDGTTTICHAEATQPCFLDLGAYLRCSAYTSTALALTPVVALCIPIQSRHAFLRNYPEQVLQTLVP